MKQIDESGQSKRSSYVFDWDLAPGAGREIFQREGTILNPPQPGYFMPQRLEQSSDFAIFPLDQNHFQM
jgi:hypothetical protein